MIFTIAAWALACFLSTTIALPATPDINPRACVNHLSNPSFETGSLDPWLPIVESAWSPNRGVVPGPTPNGSGKYYYYAQAISTVEATLTMSQSGIMLPVGSTADCYTWVAGRRSENVTKVTVFLDGVICGTDELKVGDTSWKRVGSKVKVAGGVPGMGSAMAVVATSKSAGDDGWDISIDDMGVVSC
ncbi:uncharacterized protein M421DRAFT_425664 [Didymella exigua CBS 183.55]|uniref:Uncharacterized protein n=1 Tax=Didymella exigua CBS 183.55 TaxID=1150837 RepID=A0A6A5R9C1_9PLEO|nr:uncharacterized protein M421DRAFT_425664 [Didymella exigua CBS 183.55]KAF1923604.1 hypothetical protein M421DRAFT_425664 [Didymella exigua CBS 183.55]